MRDETGRNLRGSAASRLELARAGEAPAFVLAESGGCAALWVSPDDLAGVLRAAGDLAADVERVSGARPEVHCRTGSAPPAGATVWVGTVGRHAGIDALAATGRLELEEIRGGRERWLIEIVAAREHGAPPLLVIAGSDQRGTIYGIYELCQLIGVSPWSWWADVPVRRAARIALGPGRRAGAEPKVRYRGIFLNDEEPALGSWAREKFGGFNREFYARVFELLLRLRGNFLWPAMWGSAFNEDDDNAALADDYGIVMGTSHHEPMLRAQKEWKRHGDGPWNYGLNAERLRAFWRFGAERNKRFESVITLGMRGDGDMPMSASEDVALLERIIADQTAILRDVHGADLGEVPRVVALYKEVQSYFEQGLSLPEDVTLLFCDDNWGNLRRVPTAAERARSGGAGIYYHYDYVGGPRSYKWLCTAPIGKTWQQMRLAYENGAERLWIVNVGDLKPMEHATQFFLDLARDPEAMTLEALADYPRTWAAQQFGEEHAAEIGELLSQQARFVARRKPELLAPETYSLIHYREAERVLAEHRELERRALALCDRLEPAARSAYFELVQFPIQACANLIELYVSVGRNRLYAVQGRASANAWGERARQLFHEDAALTRRYHELEGGKWRHMMAQTHLGYTYWQQPVANTLPAVTEISVASAPKLGVAIQGSPHAWPTDDPNQPYAIVPALDPYGGETRWIDVFNRGAGPLRFEVRSHEAWLRVTPDSGDLGEGFDAERRLEVSVDFARVPAGEHLGRVTIHGPAAQCVEVWVPVAQEPRHGTGAARESARERAFAETGRRIQGHRPASADPSGETRVGTLGGGYVAIEAEHFARAVGDGEVSWRVIPHYGRTLSGVAPFPMSVSPRTLRADSPRLEYRVSLTSHGPFEVTLFVSPSLGVHPGRGLSCAASLDAGAPVVLEVATRGQPEAWARSVEDGVRKLSFRGSLDAPGEHVLAFWMIDPGVVLEKIVIDMGGLCPSYLGPPESPAVPDSRLGPAVVPFDRATR